MCDPLKKANLDPGGEIGGFWSLDICPVFKVWSNVVDTDFNRSDLDSTIFRHVNLDPVGRIGRSRS